MGYKKFIGEAMDMLLDLIYPRNIHCILCGDGIEPTEKYSMCTPCRDRVKFIASRFCEKCGKPLEPLYLPQKCPDCMITHHYFTRGFSCVEYDDAVKKLIYQLKYHQKRHLAHPIGQMMADRLRKLDVGEIHMIVPVPLHRKKERERGFNQSEIIAKYMADALGIPMEKKNILRVKETETQNQLNREERRENLRDAFQVVDHKKFAGKKILIVDDIYTTGSTMDACCREIRKAGPEEIYFITFATGRNM